MFLRRAAALLALGSVIAFFVGLFNFGGHVQIGGADGFILRGWQIVLGSVLMLFGTLGLLGAYSEDGGFSWRRTVVPILLISGAAAVWIGLGETPKDFCGESYGISCP